MEPEGVEQVIDRSRKLYFQRKMGFDDNIMAKLAVEVLGGVTLTAAGSFLTLLIGGSSLSLFAKVAIALGLMTNPWVLATAAVAMVGGALTAFNAAYRVHRAFSRQEVRRRFGSNLDALGKMVSDVIFLPAIGMAKVGGEVSERARKVILKEYADWGFSKIWCEREIDRVLRHLSAEAILVSVKKFWARQPSPGQLAKKGLHVADIDLGELKSMQIQLVEKLMMAEGTEPSDKKGAFLAELKQIHSRSFRGSIIGFLKKKLLRKQSSDAR